VSDKKSSTTSTKDSKINVIGKLSYKERFSPLYITTKIKKKNNCIYLLKDGSFVELSNFSKGISYNKSTKDFTVGDVKYKHDKLAIALGVKKLSEDMLQSIYMKSEDVNVYLLKKYIPKKESTKTTPPPSTRKPKEEKPKEVVIDMTKQFEIGGNKYIPLYKKDNLLYTIVITNKNEIEIAPIELKLLNKITNIKTTNILVEKSDKDVDITRIKSEGLIYVVIDNRIVGIYSNILNTAITYKTLNDTYFNKCKQ
jgi:hypothetical protein